MAYVYCFRVGSTNCFKVGRTINNPRERKKEVSIGSPRKLTLYRDVPTETPSKLEKYIHKLLEMKRAENGEFFNVTAFELDDAIEKALAFLDSALPLFDKAKGFRKTKPNDRMLEPSKSDRTIYRQLRESQKELFFLEQKILLLQSQLQIAIGQNLGLKGIARWQWQEALRFNIRLFKEERPELYEKYKRISATRYFRLSY
jgi:hypothetical protein